jgi:hypothetical protein
MTQVKINQTDFTADVNAGLTRAELKAKYGIPVSVINDWAKALELTIKIKKAPRYVLVIDTDVVENVAATNVEEQEAVATEEFSQGF